VIEGSSPALSISKGVDFRLDLVAGASALELAAAIVL
jgi:hypothetical protein